MQRRNFLKNALKGAGLLCYSPSLLAAKAGEQKAVQFPPEIFEHSIIPVPGNPAEWKDFRAALRLWKSETRAKLRYDDALYRKPEFQWAHGAYNCYFLMMYDEAFCDPQTGKFKVDAFLESEMSKFGRFDIVVLWHAYPRIGLDDRNQFDFYRDMPGGLEGVRNVSRQLHDKGIKVFINYNPWDTGTRREDKSDIDAIVDTIAAIEADGIFLDTMESGSAEFRDKLDAARPGVVLESEYALPVKFVHDHHLSWGQWFWDGDAPGVLRNKWFEPRHIQHGISRWQTDKTKEIHTAWMNGSGVMIWENVFGQWLGWSKRDNALMRQIAPIQQRYTYLFSGEYWSPMIDDTPVKNVYANLWFNKNVRLWTLVNRAEQSISGKLLHIDVEEGERYYDLIQGVEVQLHERQGDKATFHGDLSARGVACFVAIKGGGKDAQSFDAFLKNQSEIYKTRSNEKQMQSLKTTQKPLVRTKKYSKLPEGMVAVPAAKLKQEVTFRVREIGYYGSIDESFVNIGAPNLHHTKVIEKQADIKSFGVDACLVTNAQFHAFVKATGYQPLVQQNFLKHWVGGAVPEGLEDHPVVYIDLTDARAYARWVGKRLIAEQEWQYAAQGRTTNAYPWGNGYDESKCNGGSLGKTTAVKAYPGGVSPFGCYDMCGNVWELTESEYSDGRNHFCILKGGSYYKAIGSEWYFDGGGKEVFFSAKQLLIYPGIDRCATVGFRCAVDM